MTYLLEKPPDLTHLVKDAYADGALMNVFVEIANAYHCLETPSFEGRRV